MPARVIRCHRCGRPNRVPAAASGIPRCGQCRSPLPWIADADDDDFAEITNQSAVPVLVDLWAPWCPPCRQVSPALEQLAADLAGRLKLVKVNIDDAPRIAQRFAVRAVPTLLILRDGRLVASRAGAAPGPVVGKWLEDALDRPQPAPR